MKSDTRRNCGITFLGATGNPIHDEKLEGIAPSEEQKIFVFNETILEEYFGEGGKWLEKPVALHVAGLQLTTAEPSYGEDVGQYWSE